MIAAVTGLPARPGCGEAIRLIAFITQPGPIRKILTRLGELLEPPPLALARSPPTDYRSRSTRTSDNKKPIKRRSSPAEPTWSVRARISTKPPVLASTRVAHCTLDNP